MRAFVYVLLVTLLCSATTAQNKGAKVPEELFSGYSKGYANGANYDPQKQTVRFYLDKKTVCNMNGVAAEKWHRWERFLGPCYRSQPTFQVKNPRGVAGMIYRFRGGIIVAYQGKAFVVPWDFVFTWETQGGYKKQGFPTSDVEPIQPLPRGQRANSVGPTRGLFSFCR